ncbi:MAG: hypothetical protein ACLS4Z_06430 [Christensenellaceae bacterium]
MEKRCGREGDYGNSPRQDGLRKIGFRPRGSVRGTGAGNAAAVIGNFGESGRNGKKEFRDHRKTDREPIDQFAEKTNRTSINQPAALAPSVESGAAKPASSGQPAPVDQPLP